MPRCALLVLILVLVLVHVLVPDLVYVLVLVIALVISAKPWQFFCCQPPCTRSFRVLYLVYFRSWSFLALSPVYSLVSCLVSYLLSCLLSCLSSRVLSLVLSSLALRSHTPHTLPPPTIWSSKTTRSFGNVVVANSLALGHILSLSLVYRLVSCLVSCLCFLSRLFSYCLVFACLLFPYVRFPPPYC